MRNRREFLDAFGRAPLEDLIRRLLAYANHRYGPNRLDLVLQAIEGAMDGKFAELYAPRQTLFGFLARAIDLIA